MVHTKGDLRINIKSTDGIDKMTVSIKTTAQPTTTLITSINPTSIDDLTSKQVSPIFNFVQTTSSSTDTEVESLKSCSYDEDTELILLLILTSFF